MIDKRHIFSLPPMVMLLASAAQATITLPIEVLGPDGTTAQVTVTLPTGSASTITQLWMQTHNLSYETKASLQINSGGWIDLTNTNTQVADPGKSMGGIGGAFSTIKLTISVPSGVLVDGNNTITFRFNGTDGVSSGYRILKFNFLDGGGNMILPASTFAYDNPSTWVAPSHPDGSPADPVNGQQLWQTATLQSSDLPTATPILAHCMDCHTRTGRDLKYFNYSNKSIQTRAVFHGLTPAQGADIAAFIRTSSDYPSISGRPWNPPYQPGLVTQPNGSIIPLESVPDAEWAAGAGIDSVLDSDQQSLSYIFPNGITADALQPAGNLQVHNIPIWLQLPDWNHWLPRVHPMDAWPDFTTYQFNGSGPTVPQLFQQLHDLLASYGSNVIYHIADSGPWETMANAFDALGDFKLTKNAASAPWSPDYAEKVYSTGIWALSREWERMHEFHLEESGYEFFGALAARRGWFTNEGFVDSPFMDGIPFDTRGLKQSPLNDTSKSVLQMEYLTNAWYELQLQIYTHRYNTGTVLDWGYFWGHFKDFYHDENVSDIMRFVLFMAKAGQMSTNGFPPYVQGGWSPTHDDPMNLVDPGWAPLWGNTPGNVKAQVIQAMVESWFDKTSQYSLQDYMKAGMIAPGEILSGTQGGNGGDLGNAVFYSIPLWRQAGVSETLLERVIDWAKTMWPTAPWDILRSGTIPTRVGWSSPNEPHTLTSPANITLVTVPQGVQPSSVTFFDSVNQPVGSPAPTSAGVYNDNLTNISPGTHTYSVMGYYPGGVLVGGGNNQIIVTGGAAGPAPQITSLTATPASVIFGSTMTLSWTTTNATYVQILVHGGSDPIIVPINGSYVFVPNVTGSYILTAYGPGGTVTQSISVPVTDADLPVISALTPTGPLPSGTTSELLSVGAFSDTNSAIYCRYSTTPGTAYNSMTQNLTGGPEDSPTQWTTLTGLTDGYSQTFYIRCSNGSVANTSDFPVTVSVLTANSPLLTLVSPVDWSFLPQGDVTVTYTISGSRAGLGNIHFQLDTNAEQIDSAMAGSFTFPQLTTGPHTIRGYLVDTSGSKITGSDVIVSFTVSGLIVTPSLLPTPVLNLPPIMSINNVINFSYTAQVTGFEWQFIQNGSANGGSIQSSALAMGMGMTLATPASQLALGALGLVPGNYMIQVQAVNGFSVSNPGQAATTLVAGVTAGSGLSIQVYPDPWRNDKHVGIPITFSGFTGANTTVKIFTISGHKVKELSSTSSSLTWDLINDSGDKVASGIYIYLVIDGQGNKVHGKLAIIR